MYERFRSSCLHVLMSGVVLLIAPVNRLSAQSGESHIDTELTKYLQQLCKIENYLCRVDMFRFGTEEILRDGVVVSWDFWKCQTLDVAGGAFGEMQMSYLNKWGSSNPSSLPPTEITLVQQNRIFSGGTRQRRLSEQKASPSGLLFGAFDPRVVGCGLVAELSYYRRAEDWLLEDSRQRRRVVKENQIEILFGSDLQYAFDANSKSGPTAVTRNSDKTRARTWYATVAEISVPARCLLINEHEGIWIELHWIAVNQGMNQELLNPTRISLALAWASRDIKAAQAYVTAFQDWQSDLGKKIDVDNLTHTSTGSLGSITSSYRAMLSPLISGQYDSDTDAISRYRGLVDEEAAPGHYADLLSQANIESIEGLFDQVQTRLREKDEAYRDLFTTSLSEETQHSLLACYLLERGMRGLVHPAIQELLELTTDQKSAINQRISEIQQFQREICTSNRPHLSTDVILDAGSNTAIKLKLFKDILTAQQLDQVVQLIGSSSDPRLQMSLDF